MRVCVVAGLFYIKINRVSQYTYTYCLHCSYYKSCTYFAYTILKVCQLWSCWAVSIAKPMKHFDQSEEQFPKRYCWSSVS